ncbi:hypothetical protein LHGZ1_1979 [Laribacter hongkongensis]|uniref:Uncharacterized protein n=1 Tax=Laribacter hongkongensis TaxID=168471 RepID=A0A248LJ38_9NEIS|nr:hypothetical protein [Laribacter hongkongensis]ASJ24810.1 hypothetical protein LHGZ1_1979 [Laribacter hongkongensis]MCG9014018.1 hypothetical protein [Laribacter hongkongensis]MCG9038361.1 hypothetical protein [Laribacter hongkongensis]
MDKPNTTAALAVRRQNLQVFMINTFHKRHHECDDVLVLGPATPTLNPAAALYSQ